MQARSAMLSRTLRHLYRGACGCQSPWRPAYQSPKKRLSHHGALVLRPASFRPMSEPRKTKSSVLEHAALTSLDTACAKQKICNTLTFHDNETPCEEELRRIQTQKTQKTITHGSCRAQRVLRREGEKRSPSKDVCLSA